MTTIIISNEEIKDILEIVKYPEESGILDKGVAKKIENEVKEQKEGFLGMLTAIIGTGILANKLGKTIMFGPGLIRAGEGTVRAGKDF